MTDSDTSHVGKWYAPTRDFAVKMVQRYVSGGRLLELGVNTGVISKQISAKEKFGLDLALFKIPKSV